MYALAINDLVKRYPTGTEALKGVDLTIEEGEFYGLLGPNGAGKSTLIHCTTGLAQPTSGAIEIFGHDAVHHYGDARLAVGLAPQEPNLDWFLTLEESLDFHGGYFGMSRKDRRERAPKLLILDEPTAGVDVELRLELWHYVQRINAEGTTILLTTHYLEEAEQLCNRIAFINGGEIVAQGTSSDLSAEYGVSSLEDAYLALVGRGELSRGNGRGVVKELAP